MGKGAVEGGRKALIWSVLVYIGAVVFYVELGFGLFGYPKAFTDWISCAREVAGETPRTVVVLGGGGIPSETGLIRTYYAAQQYRHAPKAKFVVCLPADSEPEKSSVGRMRDELVVRGVPKASVEMEYRGLNTHEQAQGVRRLLGESAMSRPTLIVTSPSHARRALLCFRKEGFTKVSCIGAESVGAEADMGGGESIRYGFWSNLQRGVDYLRELIALALYRVRGWI